MDEANRRRARSGRAYTGKTIALKDRQDTRQPPAILPDLPSVSADQPAGKRAAKRIAARRASQNRSQEKTSFRLSLRRTLRRVWLGLRIALLLALVLLITGIVLFYHQTSTVADAIVVPDVRPNPSIATPLIGGTNILLIGVDERPDHPEEGVRSDTLILVHLDAMGRWVSLLSIPRDTQVDLLDIGTTKINVAYGQGYVRAEELYGAGTTPQQGGMALAAQTVEDFLGLHERGMRVDYTAQVNFDGFIYVIDALGGVTIDVPTLIVDDAYPTPDYGTMRVEFQPGPTRMDGQTALIYARTRHADSDFGRSQRQQQVMHAMVSELQQHGWFGRVMLMPDVLESIKGSETQSPPILTTMPIDRVDVLAGLVVLASGLEPDAIRQVRISPETVVVTEVGSNLIWDAEGVQAQVDAMLEPPERPATSDE